MHSAYAFLTPFGRFIVSSDLPLEYIEYFKSFARVTRHRSFQLHATAMKLKSEDPSCDRTACELQAAKLLTYPSS